MVATAEIRLPSGLILRYEGDPRRSWRAPAEPVDDLMAMLLHCLETTEWDTVKAAARVLHGRPKPAPVELKVPAA